MTIDSLRQRPSFCDLADVDYVVDEPIKLGEWNSLDDSGRVTKRSDLS